jgi:putative tryptophan/tyrosine transport system substrate-binding protein
MFVFDPELEAKRLQLLKEMLPGARRIAYLSIREDWEATTWGKTAHAAAEVLGLTIVPATHTPTNYKDAFNLIETSKVDALYVYPGAPQYASRKLIIEFARKKRLPDVHRFREAVEDGALMSYGSNIPDLYRQAATYVDRILKGAYPGDLAIEQPTKFDLVINLKTARTLGLTISPMLLARADEVIE